jgi:predicted lipoprotein with Yx(FWY)xxD motif/predicted outer membrane protein
MAMTCGSVVLLLTGACRGGAATGNGDGTEAFPDVTASARKPGKPVLSAAKSESLGSIVIDSKGHTLYRFDKDSAKPSQSFCSGPCVKQWPPALAGDQLSTKGVDQDLVSKVKRRDGRWQLTLAGWPLYRFAGDRRTGDVKGQNVSGVWFVITPDGKRAQAGASAGSYDPGSGEDGARPTRFGPLTAADRDLLVRVRQAGLWGTPSAQQAQQRARSQQVKEVGQEIAEQHLRLDAEVRSVAARLRVVLPSKPSAEQQEWMDKLSAAAGKEYDKLFVNRLRAAHGEILTAVAEARASTRNSLVRAFAQRAVDTVINHMTLLEKTGLVDGSTLAQPPASPQPSTSSQSYSEP